MATQYITNLVQKAVATYLAEQSIAGLNIYKGIQFLASDADGNEQPSRAVPCVECLCQSAQAQDATSYSWEAEVVVRVRTNADDTDEDTHHTTSATVFDLLMTDSIATDLSSAITGFHAQLVVPKSQAWGIEDRCWVSTYTFGVFCVSTDLS